MKEQKHPELDKEFVKVLQEEAEKYKQFNRIEWFNSTRGTSLRLLNRHQHVAVDKGYKTCALCGERNMAVPEKMDPRTHSTCTICNVPLCTASREAEPENTCWEHWHNARKVEARHYKMVSSGSGPSS